MVMVYIFIWKILRNNIGFDWSNVIGQNKSEGLTCLIWCKEYSHECTAFPKHYYICIQRGVDCKFVIFHFFNLPHIMLIQVVSLCFLLYKRTIGHISGDYRIFIW